MGRYLLFLLIGFVAGILCPRPLPPPPRQEVTLTCPEIPACPPTPKCSKAEEYIALLEMYQTATDTCYHELYQTKTWLDDVRNENVALRSEAETWRNRYFEQ